MNKIYYKVEIMKDSGYYSIISYDIINNQFYNIEFIGCFQDCKCLEKLYDKRTLLNSINNKYIPTELTEEEVFLELL